MVMSNGKRFRVMVPRVVTKLVGTFVDDIVVGTVVSAKLMEADGKVEDVSVGKAVGDTAGGNVEGTSLGKAVGDAKDGNVEGASVGKAVGDTADGNVEG